MHSKRKGAVAELHVACFLTQKGYAVFTEMGDLSRTDLVVDIDGILIRVQVKYITRVDGCYKFTTAKSGPNYRFLYTVSDVDVFALYCADEGKVAWVIAKDIIPERQTKGTLVLRSDAFPCRNNQTKKVKSVSGFEDFDAIVLPRIHEFARKNL